MLGLVRKVDAKKVVVVFKLWEFLLYDGFGWVSVDKGRGNQFFVFAVIDAINETESM